MDMQLRRIGRPRYTYPTAQCPNLNKIISEEQALTASSEKPFPLLPPDILHDIFQLVLIEALWDRSVTATFYRSIDLSCVVSFVRRFRSVCSSWASVIGHIVYSLPARRHGVLLRVKTHEIARLQRDFPDLNGIMLSLGDPNDIEELEKLHRSLVTARKYATLECISAVAWSDSTAESSVEWPLPLKEAWEQEYLLRGYQRDAPCPGVLLERYPHRDSLVSFLHKELLLFACYQSNLILSILDLLGSYAYLELPFFVLSAPEPPVPDLCNPNCSPILEQWRRESSNLSRGASLPSAIHTAIYLEIIFFPHALHCAHAPGTIDPECGRWGKKADVKYGRNDVRLGRLITRELHGRFWDSITRRMDRLQSWNTSFPKLKGFGIRGLDVEELNRNFDDYQCIQQLMRIPWLRSLNTFHVVHGNRTGTYFGEISMFTWS